MHPCCRGVRVTLIGLTALTYSGIASAHSLGGDMDPTPPLKAYFEEVRTLAQDLPNGAIGVRGVLDQFKLWPVHTPISGCFNSGERPLRDVFVQTSLLWTPGTSLKFDFGDAPDYRTCSASSGAYIRVSFSPGGNW